MKRLFPTQLRVVPTIADLVTEEETKKGYYDPTSARSIQIGVNGDKQCIYLSSPGIWYRSYTFKLLGKQTTETDDAATEKEDNDEGDEQEQQSELSLRKNDENDLWRIVALLVKTECGRKVIQEQPTDRFLVLAGINNEMAKQFYYLLKHLLTRLGIEFKISSSLFSPPFSAANLPDVRERTKRRRAAKKSPPQTRAAAVVVSARTVEMLPIRNDLATNAPNFWKKMQ